jgi:hypothetical protein
MSTNESQYQAWLINLKRLVQEHTRRQLVVDSGSENIHSSTLIFLVSDEELRGWFESGDTPAEAVRSLLASVE